MLKAILMDFDGVIIDSERVMYDLYKKHFKEKYDIDFKISDYLYAVGSTSYHMMDKLEESYGKEINREDARAFISENTLEETNKLPCLPGVRDFIGEVKKRNIKLALCSSSNRDYLEFHLDRLGLLSSFSFLVTRGDVKEVKPAPDIFLKGLDGFGVERDQTLIIEDSKNGLEAGLKAGIRVLIVPNLITYYSSFDGAYKILPSLEALDLDEIIKDFK